MEERHLSLATVAGRLGVSERTVRRWIKAGKLKAYRPGRDYRIPESAFRAFVEESEIAPKAPGGSPLEPSLNDALAEERRRTYVEAFLREVRECTDNAEDVARALEAEVGDAQLERAKQLLKETHRRVQTCQRVFSIIIHQEELPEWERGLVYSIVGAHVRLFGALRLIRDRMEQVDKARAAAEEAGKQAAELEPQLRAIQEEMPA